MIKIIAKVSIFFYITNNTIKKVGQSGRDSLGPCFVYCRLHWYTIEPVCYWQ